MNEEDDTHPRLGELFEIGQKLFDAVGRFQGHQDLPRHAYSRRPEEHEPCQGTASRQPEPRCTKSWPFSIAPPRERRVHATQAVLDATQPLRRDSRVIPLRLCRTGAQKALPRSSPGLVEAPSPASPQPERIFQGRPTGSVTGSRRTSSASANSFVPVRAAARRRRDFLACAPGPGRSRPVDSR